jgi:NAD(P)-dependent dehydrogenase (short-subunit alcohol dehydrogenase family)
LEDENMAESRLDGRVALVTGGGSDIGLGWAMASALLEAGAKVALMDVDGDALSERLADARRSGDAENVIAITGDVTKLEDGPRAVRETQERLGGLHILVNNAGINPARGAAFWDLDPQAWLRTIATNLSGPFLMARAAIAPMRVQGWGRIISVTTSFDTMLRSAPYGPAKAGHEALVAVMARELEASGVTANVLVPGGATLTRMTAGSTSTDTSHLLRPEVMRAPVVWLASDASDGFNGRRVVGRFWDENLPVEQRLARASAPVGWAELAQQATASRGGIL